MVVRNEPAGQPGFRPAHPGRILRRNLDALGMTQEAFAEHISVSRQTVSAIIAGRSGVTAEIAAKFGRAFNTTSQFWSAMQLNHDIWGAEQSPEVRAVKKVTRHKSTKAAHILMVARKKKRMRRKAAVTNPALKRA